MSQRPVMQDRLQVTLAGSQVAEGITTPGPQAVESPRLVASAADIAPAQSGADRAGDDHSASAPASDRYRPVADRSSLIFAPPTPMCRSIFALHRRWRLARCSVAEPCRCRQGCGAGAEQRLRAGSAQPCQDGTDVAIGGESAGGSQEASTTRRRPGDTVSKMARKYYGLDTKTNRDLIIAANKSLKSDPEQDRSGQELHHPGEAGSISAAQAAAAPIGSCRRRSKWGHRAAVRAPVAAVPWPTAAIQHPPSVRTP